MKKLNLKSGLKFRPKFLWGCLIFFLLSTTTLFYLLRKEEANLRLFTQKQLATTQKNLIDTLWAKIGVEKELTAEKNKSQILSIELDQKKRELKFAALQLEKELAARRQAETQLIAVIEEKKGLEEKVKELTKAPKTIELERIIVTATAALAGEVIGVNREYNFIVTSLGRKDNIQIGDILSVYRQDTFIGEARVEKVEERLSAAAILSDWQEAEFKEKDIVKAW